MNELIKKSLKFAEDMRLQCLSGYNLGHISELDLLNSICVYQDAAIDAILTIMSEDIQSDAELENHLVKIVRYTFPNFEVQFYPKLQLVKG